MRHLIGQILAVAVAALPGVAWADAPKPEPVEITHEGAKLKGFLYRPEGNGPFPAVVALHDCDGLAGRRMPLARPKPWHASCERDFAIHATTT